jgi:hypothetical protein
MKKIEKIFIWIVCFYKRHRLDNQAKNANTRKPVSHLNHQLFVGIEGLRDGGKSEESERGETGKEGPVKLGLKPGRCITLESQGEIAYTPATK